MEPSQLPQTELPPFFTPHRVLAHLTGCTWVFCLSSIDRVLFSHLAKSMDVPFSEYLKMQDKRHRFTKGTDYIEIVTKTF